MFFPDIHELQRKLEWSWGHDEGGVLMDWGLWYHTCISSSWVCSWSYHQTLSWWLLWRSASDEQVLLHFCCLVEQEELELLHSAHRTCISLHILEALIQSKLLPLPSLLLSPEIIIYIYSSFSTMIHIYK